MKWKAFIAIFLIFTISACSSTTSTIASEEIIFQGEGDYWTVRYTFNPELYEEKKVNWVELEWKNIELSQDIIHNMDIKFESRDGTITGKVGDMETSINDNVISFLVGTVNHETYLEDEYKITINSNDKQEVIKLRM